MWFEVIFIYLFLTAADKVIIMVYSSYFCSLIVRLFGFLIFFEHSVDRSVSSNLVKIFFCQKIVIIRICTRGGDPKQGNRTRNADRFVSCNRLDDTCTTRD